MQFTERQMQAAKDSARLHGFDQDITDDQAYKFLVWYHSHNTEYSSVVEAAYAGLMQLRTNGLVQQSAFWKELLE